MAAAPSSGEPAPATHAVRHVAPKVKKVASSDLDAAPKPVATKPAGGGAKSKKAAAWQDPFAQ
jgi:hypothetical protein